MQRHINKTSTIQKYFNAIKKTQKQTYNSDVSGGMPLGISFSFALEHLTTVPVQEHFGGQ